MPLINLLVVLIVIGVVIWAVTTYIPSSKEMAAILIIPKIANNTKVSEMPNKLLDLANSWIEELAPKRNQESK